MKKGDRVLTPKGAGTVAGFWTEHDRFSMGRLTFVIVALDAGYRRLFPPSEIQVLERSANG